jgi:hypothetical protein
MLSMSARDTFSRAFFCAAGLVFWCCAPAAAAVTAAQSFPAFNVDAGPAAALDFTGEPWKSAPAMTGFETVTTRTAAAHPTTARVVLDGRNIYVAIEAEQRGIPLTTTQTTNNVGFGLDDFAGIGIDTTGSGQSYYFEATPSGVRYQQSNDSARFTPQWTALAKPTADGWRALLVIPFDVLRTPSTPVQRWRFNIVRHIAAINENETWAYDGLMSDAGGNNPFPLLTDARFWPYLDGVKISGKIAKPKPRAELYALASAGGNRTIYQQATNTFAPQGTRNFGADVNVPLTGTISFVGALAPDFSNVEIDQQTIAPQEFRRNLTEYRPFFAQGANNFQPVSLSSINSGPNLIFYSPGIGPFDRGEKIEGTYGLQTLGLLNVSGAGFNDTVFGLSHKLEDRTFEYSFDAISAHHADGNATAYTSAADDFTYDATVAGRNLHNGFVYAFDYGAERGSVPGTTPSLAYKSEDFIDVHKQNYESFIEYRDIGPKWNPVDGFTNLADIRGPGSFLDLVSNPQGNGPFKREELFIFGDRLVERSGAAHQSDFFINADLVFRNQLHLSGGPSTSSIREYQNGLSLVGYDFGYQGGVTVPYNQHSISVGYKDGTPTPIDFSYAFGPFTTNNADGTFRPTYLKQYSLLTSRPLNSRFNLSAEYDGSLESYPAAQPGVGFHDTQTLRRLTLGESFGDESNLTISLRDIAGTGGFAAPGLNLAAGFHRRFRNDSELFVNYGTPAANSTLQRVIVKYLLRLGSGAGT